MRSFKYDQPKTISLRVSVNSDKEFRAIFRFEINNYEFGIPAKISPKFVMANIPPLSELVGFPLEEKQKFPIRLDILYQNTIKTIWKDDAIVKDIPAMIEVVENIEIGDEDIEEENNKNEEESIFDTPPPQENLETNTSPEETAFVNVEGNADSVIQQWKMEQSRIKRIEEAEESKKRNEAIQGDDNQYYKILEKNGISNPTIQVTILDQIKSKIMENGKTVNEINVEKELFEITHAKTDILFK